MKICIGGPDNHGLHSSFWNGSPFFKPLPFKECLIYTAKEAHGKPVEWTYFDGEKEIPLIEYLARFIPEAHP